MFDTISSPSLITNVRHLLAETRTSSLSPIWVIGERNSSQINPEISQPSVRIMWYRFFLVIIIFITAAGNLLVCLAIARERKLQNTTNYFLMSLAIADCLVALLVMPIGMVTDAIGYFPLPDSACIIFATMDVLCCTSSIWHMSTMSMDRYFTIRFPFRYGRNKTRRIMLLKIVAVWAISAAVSSPVFVLGIVDRSSVLSTKLCAPSNASFKIYGSIFAFYIPFVIMIVTYALTMRSLRNVLVNKKKYNRERRQKQTFRPLAQIINQYAEIAQGIRRTSSSKKQIISSSTINNNHPHPNSVSNKAPYTIITTTSPTDSRRHFYAINNTNLNLQQENVSITLINEPTADNDLIHHNSQHLSLSYIKSSGSKKRRYQPQQQGLTMDTSMNRTKNGIDMSTVYEITEYSKSTSSSHDVAALMSNNMSRRPMITYEQQPSLVVDKSEQSNPISTLVVNDISPLAEEEDVTSELDVDSRVDRHEPVYLQITSFPTEHVPSSQSSESILLTISRKSSLKLLQYILHYYIFFFPYRLHPTSIEYISNTNPEPSKINQSTSTTTLCRTSVRYHRSISTQTNSSSSFDLHQIHSSNVDENHMFNSPKRRRFPFNRPVLPSSSLLTNFFRHSPTIPIRSSESSTKSSLSWGQRSSGASSSHQIRRPYSSSIFHRIESEQEHALPSKRRSRTSTSTSSLLHTTCHHESQRSAHYPARLRRQQYQSRSAHVLANSPKVHRCHRQMSSTTTNTNSTDSSSILHRYQSRLIHNVSQQQRLRDEDIVAANERKALRVLMIIFCVFVTLWAPFFICTFISAISETYRDRISSTVWFSITWLGYSSSMANPFIYTIFSDVFRRAFINILCCRSNDPFRSRQFSTKLSYPRAAAQQYIQQRLSCRRRLNHDISGTSTPGPIPHPTPIGGSDAMIYINRCASDTFR